jgi:hypothetical protein
VVVADDTSVRGERTGLENHPPVTVYDRRVQPRSSRRIRGRKFVAGEIVDFHNRFQGASGKFAAPQTQSHGLLLQVALRPISGERQLLRKGNHTEFVAISIEHA